MKNNAAENPAAEGNELSDLASELRDTYELLDRLCTQLKGGGIVQARDIEPTVAQAVPKLRHAVMWLNSVSMVRDSRADSKRVSKNPLLI
jgi:hypothetical protein